MRSLTELFALAERARKHDDVEHGAVGADGYGFALANAHETERFQMLGMGSKIASLPTFTNTGLVGNVAGLVRGCVKLQNHIEELFALTLVAVSPKGGQRVLRFYHGPSGLALGATRESLTQKQAQALAASWERALRKAPTIDFQLEVASDFGTSWLVVQDGKATYEKKRRAHVPLPPAILTTDAAALKAALAQREDDVADFDVVQTAWEVTPPKIRKPHEKAYKARVSALRKPAFADLEAALARGTLSPAHERVAPAVLFSGIRIDRERQQQLFSRWMELLARSATRW